jgi:hypothetical protein
MEIALDDEKQLPSEKMYYKYIFLSKNQPVPPVFSTSPHLDTSTLNQ